MRGEPSARALIEAVAQWLGTSGDGAARDFATRVARNALGIAARELELVPAAERSAVERLRALTGRDGGFDELEALLCAMIRDGAVALDDPHLRAHLAATALDRLAIDQPGYVHALRRPEEGR